MRPCIVKSIKRRVDDVSAQKIACMRPALYIIVAQKDHFRAGKSGIAHVRGASLSGYQRIPTVALKVSPQGHVSGRSPQCSGSSLR